MKSRLLLLVLLAALLIPAGACTNLNKTQQGGLTGAVGGAAVGAGISALAGGNWGVGAALGGVLGGVAGSIYGHNKSKQ